MNMRGQLTTPEAVCQFMNAGNATITLVSRKTGTRRTYKIRDGGKLFFVSVLTGPDNSNDFEYLGTVHDLRYSHGRKSRIGPTSPANTAFEWFYNGLATKPYRIMEQVEVWHEGRCGACGRTLTVPESVARGFGPECATKFACEPVPGPDGIKELIG